MYKDYFYSLATDKPRPCAQGRGKSRSYCSNVIKFFLFILSLFYGLGLKILIFFCSLKAYRLNCKVISVGNITWGGTGKTPLVEAITRYLKQEGHKTAILTRGYGRKIAGCGLRLPAGKARVAGYENMGDEPYMLSKNLVDIPVIVDANRIRAANRALRDYGVDGVILDDGFQQWRIKKDLEIVAIDASNPFGNRHLLPRGILREPLSSLRRADVFVLTKTNLMPDTKGLRDFLTVINPRAGIFESIHSPVGFYRVDDPGELLEPNLFKGKTVTLISAIADPDSFENLIIGLGLNIGLSFRFSDHHVYSDADFADIVKKSQEKNIDAIVTTEKDSPRLTFRELKPGTKIFVLKIELKLTAHEKEFFNRIHGVFTD